MNREKSVLQKRLGQDTLDRSMRINIDGPYLHNFDTEKLVSDCIEFAVTWIYLYGHNSFRTEMMKLKKMSLIYTGKIIITVFIFFLTWMK